MTTRTAMTTVDLGLGETGLTQGCGCEGESGCGCRSTTLERPRWFGGQLVGPADLEALQQWVIGRSRRHNRLLHGWGVVCGLAVDPTLSPLTQDPEPWSVTVQPGLALTGCGDEASVPRAIRIDVRQPNPSGSDVCTPPVDTWCAPVRQRRDPDRIYYLAIRYAEEQRRPVPSMGCGCGCDDDPCEYSRFAESVAFGVLDELPDCYRDDSSAEVADAARPTSALAAKAAATSCSPLIKELGTRPCPSCCSPWVVLADLRVSSTGEVSVDALSHRRFVAGLSELAFTCALPAAKSVVLGGIGQATIKSLMAEAAAPMVTTGNREAVLNAPATMLRGARASGALEEVIGDRSVASLAALDLAALRAAAAARGVDPDDVQQIHERAHVVALLAEG